VIRYYRYLIILISGRYIIKKKHSMPMYRTTKVLFKAVSIAVKLRQEGLGTEINERLVAR
jgi:hypothetical protein